MLSRGWMRPVAALAAALGLLTGIGGRAAAQDRPGSSRATRPSLTREEQLLLAALAKNPITFPFRFSTSVRDGKVVLSGTVGTHVVHDAAVQTATALGIIVDDELVIDTAAAHAAAAAGFAGPPGPSGMSGVPGSGMNGTRPPMQAGGMPPYRPYSWAQPAMAPPYVYPRPLFGYYDDPFYGFEPPIITYPPWWGAMSARRLPPADVPGTTTPEGDDGAAPPDDSPAGPQDASLPPNTVEMTIDPTGHATLRGTVPTLSDRIMVGQRLAQDPGISGVTNLIEVDPNAASSTSRTQRDATPPPPSPADVPDAPAPDEKPAGAADREDEPENEASAAPGGIAVDRADRGGRLVQALKRRPALATLPIRATLRDGVARLSGRVPSVFEAMLAYRVVQQTPGVRSIDDRLEFPVPEVGDRNPLIEKGRPEDVEPYLQAQLIRQFGDDVHIDRVRLLGDQLDVHGTLLSVDDRPRAEAILRSMPILRGFHVNAVFATE